MSNRTFVTGDIHLNVDIHKLSFEQWPLSRELDKTDILIICGDAGLLWNNSKETNYWCDWLNDRPYTVISVLGNHENYPAIRAQPLTQWNGGLVRTIRPSVYYAENGEIFTINNKTFFFMGGAHSVDRAYRVAGKSWWPEEIPSYTEFAHAADNLQLHNCQVDFVISHTAPTHLVRKLFPYEDASDPVTNFLEKYICDNVKFTKQFMGHFHIDRTIDDKYYFMYDDIMEI